MYQKFRTLEMTAVVSRKCIRRIRETTKNHLLDVAKKYVETYSSSNAAAQDPEEWVQLTNIQYIQYKIYFLAQKLQKEKKIERTR